MKTVIIYSSKTGNTEKVARAIQQGLQGAADMIELDLTPEGILQDFSPSFTMDLSEYDLVFLGGWTMIMRVHPYLAAYIQKCRNIEGKAVAGFLTGGAVFSRGHVREDFTQLLEGRGARVVDFLYITTLLGPALTRRKLRAAAEFAAGVARRLEDSTGSGKPADHTHNNR